MNLSWAAPDVAPSSVPAPRWLAPVVLLALTACIFGFFFPITDVGLSDETSYLVAGVEFFKSPPSIESGPLYSLWYFLLKLLFRDSYVVYFLSWVLLVVLCLAIPFLIERSRRAIVYAILAAFMPFYIVWPYINLFSAAIVLVGLSIIETRTERSYTVAFGILLLTCVVVALVRPEYQYACYAAFGFFLAAVVLEGKAREHLLLIGICVAAFVGVELLFAALPGNRSGAAFAGHHDVIYFEQGKLSENPWTAWNAYKLFGLSQDATLLDFMRANPKEFWSHIYYNMTRPLFIGLLTIGALTLSISSVRVAADRRIAPTLMPLHRLIPLAVVYLPAVSASAIMYPKNHYLVIPFLVSAFYIARSDLVVALTRRTVVIGLLVALAFASIAVNYKIKLGKLAPYKFSDTLECLVDMQRQRGIYSGGFLEALGGANAYLKGDTFWIRHYSIKDGESLDSFLNRTSPVVVIVDENLFGYMKAKGNVTVGSIAELNGLIQKHGFTEYKCRSPGPSIFYAN